MIIGFLTPEYPSDHYIGKYGGIGTFIKGIATQLVRANHKVFVFIHSQKDYKIVEENGVELHFIKRKSLKGFTWWINRKHSNIYINKIIKKEGIQILEAPEWTGFTAFMKFKCPLVLRLHGSDTYFCHLEGRSVKFKNKLYETNALKRANAVVGVSQFVADETIKLFKIDNSISIVHNAIDTSEFVPNHKNIQHDSILYFGSIIRKKGVLELANAFNQVVVESEGAKLTMLGKDCIDNQTGRSTISIVKDTLSSKAKINVQFIDEVPFEKVKEIICSSEVVVLPSFAEAFPMTWLEAMALEKKMVTSNIGWAEELMINGKTGFIVNPLDKDLLSKSILAMLERTEEVDAMGKNARKRIQSKFELNDALVKNIEFYQSVIDEY